MEIYCPKSSIHFEWRKLLQQIGLQHVVTQDLFLTFARQIANRASQIGSEDEHKRLVEQSTILAMQLNENKLLMESAFLKQLADIKFLPSVPIEKELRELHPPYIGDHRRDFEPFISYRGAVPAQYKELTWSVALLLPSSVVPEEKYVTNNNESRVANTIELHKCLGIDKSVIKEKALLHIQKVCYEMAKRNAVEKVDNVSPATRKKLLSITKKMMRYLLNSLDKHNDDIKQCPICPVENGSILVTADRLVFNVSDETMIKRLRPYLFQAPRELEEFDTLFITLGAQHQMTFDQLAGVLWKLKCKCKEDKMEPNEQQAAYTAVSCMFHMLYEHNRSKTNCPISVAELFLPTPEDKLKRSTDLYYADPHCMDRMELASTNLELVVPLKQCGIEFDVSESDLMKLLPSENPHLQPTNITDVMTETPCDSNEPCPARDDCPLVQHFKRIITSKELEIVLLRIVQHQNKGKKPTNNQKEKVESLKHFSSFRCVVKLKTNYHHEGTRIERKGSRKVFLVKSEQDDARFKLFLEHQDPQRNISGSFYGFLASNINIICNLKLNHKHLQYLREVVACRHLDDMNNLLIDFEIPEYDTTINEDQPDLAKPGTLVPEDIQHLLNDDPYNLFYPEEIVVFKSPVADENVDERDQEEYLLVFARIIKETTSEGTSHLKRKYQIHAGKTYPVVVSVLKLFKFRRPREPTDTTVAVFTGDPDTATASPEHCVPPPRDLEEAKNRIREAVKEVFSLPESEQKEAIRRLYKTWHPDKNPPEQSRLYNEAFKFLKEELDRQKQGGTSRDYSRRYDRWESDIRREKEQERSYQQRYRQEFSYSHYTGGGGGRRHHHASGSYYRSSNHNSFNTAGSWHNSFHTSGSSFVPPSFSSAVPDLQNAHKWYRQAEQELHKTQKQFDSGLNAPWFTAFHLHQVVEIALKAAKFYLDGKPNKSSTDLVSLVIDLEGVVAYSDLVSRVTELIRLGVDFHKPRYPDSYSSSMQKYANFEEVKGLHICREILELVRGMIGIRQY